MGPVFWTPCRRWSGKPKSWSGVLRNLGSRLPFLIAVALIAAAIGDPLVETISNSGALGHGYSDNNHLSVIPTLIAGASLALLLLFRRCLELLRQPTVHRNWLIEMAREISARSPVADVPYVIVLQFAALFAMENAEQLFFSGTLDGGTVWLGGPIWFSLLVHITLGCICTVLVARGMRAILRRCAAIVGIALEFILDAFAKENTGVFARFQHEVPRRFARNLRARQRGERAPPLLYALT